MQQKYRRVTKRLHWGRDFYPLWCVCVRACVCACVRVCRTALGLVQKMTISSGIIDVWCCLYAPMVGWLIKEVEQLFTVFDSEKLPSPWWAVTVENKSQ